MKRVSTAAGIGVLLLLAGCGGGSEDTSSEEPSSESSESSEEATAFAESSAEDITTAAEEDMKAVESLRMAGSITSGGQEISVDVGLSTAGDCEGNLTLGEEAGFEILSVEGQTWIKPSAAFWEQVAGPAASEVAEKAGDKWVSFPADQASQFASICDLDGLLDELDSSDSNEKMEVEGTEEIDGEEAVVVNTTSKDGETVNGWVATSDPHYILQLEVSEGDEPGTLTFSDFDVDLALEPPAEDEIVDLASLAPSGATG